MVGGFLNSGLGLDRGDGFLGPHLISILLHIWYTFKNTKGMLTMKIILITVGKIKEKYLKQGIEEYLKRLRAYAKVDIIEVADKKAPETMSEAEMLEVKRKEGERILSHISPDTYVITLEINGKMLTSEQLAAKLDELATYGKSKITFVIGGSLGISEAVQKRSDFALSFSKMTFPHQLMRMVLLEQVYRAYRIIRGEPYHK